MKNLLIIFVILLFNSLNIFAQKTITIGILVDQNSENTEPLVSKLKEDIIAVSGSEANIIFKGILQNNFDLDEANSNYQNLVESNTDIILSFGTVNSLMLIQKDITAAYIAPKGFSEPIRSAKSGIKRINLSSGAYFYDGSIRMGVSNVIKRSNGQNDYDVKYLAEEQPDVAREFVKTLTAKAGMKIGNKSEESIKAEAELLTSLTNNIQKLATESATLNLSRSILYRLNESLYNNVSKEQIELFQMVANKLIELQEKEFEAKLMSEKSKILADLNSAISELQELGFEKNKIIGLIDKAVGTTK